MLRAAAWTTMAMAASSVPAATAAVEALEEVDVRFADRQKLGAEVFAGFEGRAMPGIIDDWWKLRLTLCIGAAHHTVFACR